MLTDYFSAPSALARHRNTAFGGYLDGFAAWLADQGYKREKIRVAIQNVTALGLWLPDTVTSQMLDENVLGRYDAHLRRIQRSLVVPMHAPRSQWHKRDPGVAPDRRHLDAMTVQLATERVHDAIEPRPRRDANRGRVQPPFRHAPRPGRDLPRNRCRPGVVLGQREKSSREMSYLAASRRHLRTYAADVVVPAPLPRARCPRPRRRCLRQRPGTQ